MFCLNVFKKFSATNITEDEQNYKKVDEHKIKSSTDWREMEDINIVSKWENVKGLINKEQ